MSSGGKIKLLDDTEGTKYTTEYRASYTANPNDYSQSSASAATEKDREWKYHGVEAAKICHFFQNALTDIGENIKRDPSYGPVAEHLDIKCRPTKVSKVQPKINNLEKECCSLNVENVTLKPDYDKWQLGKFIEKETKSDFLFYLNEKEKEVSVVARDYNTMSLAVHKLKVHLGDITVTPSSRQNRTLCAAPEVPARNYAEKVKGDKGNRDTSSASRWTGKYENDSRNRYVSPNRAGSSSSSKFSFEVSLRNEFKLKVYEASITNLDVDVIVNAANDCLAHGGGVARVIADAAGDSLNWESRDHVSKHGNLKVSENCVTTAGRLNYKGVIHAVGPQWYDYRDKEKCLDALFDCIWNIFETCDKKKYRKVAMSAISAGIYGVPKELCAKMYVKAAVDYSDTAGRKYPRELHIIDVDVQILRLVRDSYETWKKHPEYINQKNSISYYFKFNPSAVSSSGYSGHHSNSGGKRANRKFDRNDNQVKGAVTPAELPKLPVQVKKMEDEDQSSGVVSQKFMVGKSLIVKIYTGAIQKVENVDAIACGIDKSFTRTGYIVSVLKKEGGSEYERALDSLKRKCYLLQPNDVKVCPGGKLAAFKVLHLVTERILFASETEISKYKDGIVNILEEADRNELEKIAIPLIGAGSIESDSPKLQICCKAFIEAICKYCDSDRTSTNVRELHLVNNKDTVYKMLRDTFIQASQSSNDTFSSDDDEEVNRASGWDKANTRGTDGVGRSLSPSGGYEDMETEDSENVYSSINMDDKDHTGDGSSSATATGEEDSGQKGNLKIIFE